MHCRLEATSLTTSRQLTFGRKLLLADLCVVVVKVRPDGAVTAGEHSIAVMAVTVCLMDRSHGKWGRGRLSTGGEGHRGAELLVGGNGREGGGAAVTWRDCEGNQCSDIAWYTLQWRTIGGICRSTSVIHYYHSLVSSHLQPLLAAILTRSKGVILKWRP